MLQHGPRYLLLQELNTTANQGWNESHSDSLIIQTTATDWLCLKPLQISISPLSLCDSSVPVLALTWAPEGDALLLVGLADAVVAVPIHAVAAVPVVQVHVGRALRAGPRAELGQVAGIARLSARNPRRFELQNRQDFSGCAVAGSATQHLNRFLQWPGPS